MNYDKLSKSYNEMNRKMNKYLSNNGGKKCSEYGSGYNFGYGEITPVFMFNKSSEQVGEEYKTYIDYTLD